MRKNTRHVVFALSIVAISVAMATPASAQVWKSAANENVCLGVAAGTMTPGTQIITWSCNGYSDQTWGQYAFSGSFVQVWTHGSSEPPDSASRCIALANNGSISNGTHAIIWNCTTATDDQGWDIEYEWSDANFHACYRFINKKANDQGYLKALTASATTPQNGTNVVIQPYSGATNQVWCAY